MDKLKLLESVTLDPDRVPYVDRWGNHIVLCRFPKGGTGGLVVKASYKRGDPGYDEAVRQYG